MIQLYIQSEHQWLIDALIEKLKPLNEKLSVITSSDPTWSYELSYPSRLVLNQPRLVNSIREAVSPLRCPERVTSKLSRNTIYLRLGSSIPLKRHPLQLSAESARIQEHISSALNARFDVQRRRGSPLNSTLRYGGASLFVRDVVRLACATYGITLAEERVWGDEELELYLSVLDPELRGPALRSTLEICLKSDTALDDLMTLNHLFKPFVDSLNRSGYQNIKHLSHRESAALDDLKESFSITLDGYHAPEEVKRLTVCVQRGLAALDVSAERYPVQVTRSSARVDRARGAQPVSKTGVMTGRVIITCPLKRLRDGALYPIGGDHPTRWTIVIKLDDLAWAESLKRALARHGFTRVLIDTEALDDPDGGSLMVNWASMLSYSHRCSSLRAAILEVVEPPLWIDVPLCPEREPTPPLEGRRRLETSSERENIVEVSLYTRDLDSRQWRAHLSSLAEECSLTLTAYTQDHAVDHIYASFGALPWLDISLELLSDPSDLSDLEELFTPEDLRALIDDDAHLDELEELLISSGASPMMDEGERTHDRSRSSYEWLDMRLDALHSVEDGLYDRPRDEICLRFGGAPAPLIAWVRARLMFLTQAEVTLSREFTDDDLEIWVELPPQTRVHEADTSQEMTPLDSIIVTRSTSPKLWLVNAPLHTQTSRRR